MTILRALAALAASASIASMSGSAFAQRQPPSPDQRLERLERQVQQIQRQVFPRGRPADTAGFANEPAATQSSVVTLDQRLDALERQMADILRLSEENGNRLRTLESDLARARSDQEQRIATLEQRISEAVAAETAAPAVTPAADTPPKAATPKPPAAKPKTDAASTAGGPDPQEAADSGEDAYSEGFHLWEAGRYDEAISSLSAFVANYPRHRRLSYAKNLIGRALLDKGDARAAAKALLENYRSNPDGARAQDSLYYLGQSLMKLGQSGQACNAYAELESVYGSKVRADLKKQIAAAKTDAQCG
ncbi:MAG TPA: tetratricopeptide repeat protein [Sphingomicrobium sp.]|nr:tetratricopeptide repeat protein [Sphingomicrobium sp.]